MRGMMQLLETNYCKAAIDRFDGGKPWTMKPTHILIHGGEQDLRLPLCNRDCKYRFPDEDGKPGLHRYAICIDERSAQGQKKAEGGMRYAIPSGLFHTIVESHEKHLCSQASPKPKVVACEACVALIANNIVDPKPQHSKRQS